jgi:PAP2 superfamily
MVQLMIDGARTPVVPDAEAPVRRPRWWVESLLVLWLAWLYDVVNDFAPLRPVAPYNHALGVLHLEQRLGLSPESVLNNWLAIHHTTGWWAANYYDIAHYTVTFAVLGWLWWRRPDLYRPLRRGLVLVNLVGFVIFWCYPMAPPRLTPGQQFVDVVATTHAFGSWHSGALAKAADELAAMPSLHIAWAMWSSLALWRMYRHRRWAPLVLCYPAATALTVVATGNHFLTDTLAGALTLIVAMLIAERWYPRATRWWQCWWAGPSGGAADGLASNPAGPGLAFEWWSTIVPGVPLPGVPVQHIPGPEEHLATQRVAPPH